MTVLPDLRNIEVVRQTLGRSLFSMVAGPDAAANRARIAVALGPTIRQPNYEVGPEFVERFLAADVDNARFFGPSERDGHAMFDLTGYIADRVARARVANFEDLGLCTYAEPERFYSYRRTTQRGEPDYGRHVNAIALVN